MKKYLILLIFGLCTAVLCQQIPNITKQFSKECYTVPIISAEANESVSCKGIILGNKDSGFKAKIQISEDDILRVEEGQSEKEGGEFSTLFGLILDEDHRRTKS